MNVKLLSISILSLFLNTHFVFAQKVKTCDVVIWKGRKANYHMEKMPIYTGKDTNNAAVVFYHDYSFKTQIWKRRPDGIYCLGDTSVFDRTFRVIDTVKCRDFRVQYCGYHDIIIKGTKQTVKGICPETIVPHFKKKLTDKLIQEGFLTEAPDDSLKQAYNVVSSAMAKYQEKYDLGVGNLSLETAKHMKLIN